MKCQACKREMFIVSGGRVACSNPNCTEFAGNNLNEPKKTIKVEAK